MTNEITDKIFVAMLQGGVRIYLNAQERENLISALKNKVEFLEINNYFIKSFSLLYIVLASELEMADKIKRGFWQCEKGHWNDRGVKVCGGCYI